MKTSLNPGQRLLWFIDAILMEERKYRAWNQARLQDLEQLDQMHCSGQEEHLARFGRDCVYQKHLELFERHRKMHTEHDEVSRYCVSLMSKINDNQLTEDEISEEIAYLSTLYESLRLDHTRMQKERQALVREHHQIVGVKAQHA